MNLTEAPTIPDAEELTSERPLPVPSEVRSVVQAKTLGLVAAASKFHGLEFEGLVLEFIVDKNKRIFLHGCWDATMLSFRQGTRPIRSGPLRTAIAPDEPSMYPVPSVVAAVEAEKRAQAELDEPFWGELKEEQRCLLEVWKADELLGEALLPTDDGLQQIRLPPHREPDIRPPSTRRRALQWARKFGGACISVDLLWPGRTVGRSKSLRFSLRSADGDPQLQRSRVVIWAQPVSQPQGPWRALWTSREATGATGPGEEGNYRWNETVEICLEPPDPDPRLQRSPSSPGRGASNLAPGGAAQTFQTEVHSGRDLVAGAEWTTHWGTSEVDGTLRGGLLAVQALQRCGVERVGRPHLLMQLALQLEGYSELQQVWSEKLADAKASVTSQQEQVVVCENEAERIKEQTAAMVAEHEKKLADTCKELSAKVDEHRAEEHADDHSLRQSARRITEQRGMVAQLAARSESFQASLDETVRKFDQVSSSYAQVQGDLMRAQVVRAKTGETSLEGFDQAEAMAAEVKAEAERVAGLREQLATIQESLMGEKNFTARLEAFVKRIAAAPAARLRTGGGFQLDNTIKSEALAFL
eukprot:CAMPEP_0206431980 /NCGR_PEP_ID=MMETSP0324_2-20121206/7661_1 /ASSEMBLY_ACC=CAM_ASM_000836 /TAXON_ID=2866 /ORGANISM="Crypthecodinium cohnii, Strain Seligo" /LENGTH=584 /DNA_ID=CAMNT_0053897959 /DNA_START=508 /DNA_END=2259 /DNA_ORIENTATION=+